MSDADGTGDVQRVPTLEKVVMALSVLLTVFLFGFAAWHASMGPDVSAPEVRVTETNVTADGDVIYIVELRNPGDVGIVRATVVADCRDPPIRLTFENVPSGGRRLGTVVCPPGASTPRLSIESWIHQ